MPNDTIMDLHRQGLSPREISAMVGRTPKAIDSYIRRYNERGGPPRPVRTDVPPDTPLKALADASQRFGATNKARWIAMYLVSTSLDYGSTRTATAFDTSRNTLIRACNNVEDWRDDPDLDEWISEWEQKNSPGY